VNVVTDSVAPVLQGVPEIVAVAVVEDVVKWRQGGRVGLLNVYGETPPVNEIV
jgi:hypothetical protein